MRKFAPAFLEAFQFNASDAEDELKKAITLLRDQNRIGKRMFSVTVDGYSDIAQRHRKISDIAQRH